MADHVDAVTYLQLEPVWGPGHHHSPDDPAHLKQAKVVAHTLQRPARPRPGTVLIKLVVRVPKGAFMPLRPEAIVVIPEGMTTLAPIEVEASEPEDGKD